MPIPTRANNGKVPSEVILIKKTVIVSIALIFMTFAIITSFSTDTEYAVKYAQVLGSYDIKEVDRFLESDTKITYNGVTDTYKNLRKNVIAAFEKKEYVMGDGYSYGHGSDIFIKGIQKVGVNAYVDSEKFSSNYVSMNIKRKFLFFHKVESLESEDDFFGYLFFGIEEMKKME